jgi:hypothetical protein
VTRRLAFFVLFAALAPAAAIAAGPQALNLRDGVPAELLAKTLGLARGLFALSLVLALAVESFGSSPDRPKSYGGVAWRALVVVALLGGYPKLFGTVIVTAEAVAARIAPQEVWDRFAEHAEQSVKAMTERERRRAGEEGSAAGEVSTVDLLSSSNFVANYVGGALFDTLVSFLVMAGQAFQWVFGQLSRILLALFYIVGPLALVFHIPGPSGTAGKWFSAFVTIACWPVLSAVLLAIATSLMYRTNDSALDTEFATAFGAVASALLMVVLNLAVPLLASAIVGGGIRNIAAASLAGAVAGATLAARAGARVLGGSGKAGSPAGPGGGGAEPLPVPTNPGAAPNSMSGAAGAAPSAGVPPGAPSRAGAAPASQSSPPPSPADPVAVALGVADSPGPAPHGPAGAYQVSAASVPLVAEPSYCSYEPPVPPTSPGHPFDPLKDKGWGDIAQLKPIDGGARQAPPPPGDLQERITAPPEHGLIQFDRLQKNRVPTKS